MQSIQRFALQHRRITALFLCILMIFTVCSVPARAAALPTVAWLLFGGAAVVAAILSAYGLSQTGPEWDSYTAQLAGEAHQAILSGALDVGGAPVSGSGLDAALPMMWDAGRQMTLAPAKLVLWVLQRAQQGGLMAGQLTINDIPRPSVGDQIAPISGTLDYLLRITGTPAADFRAWAAAVGITASAGTYVLCRSRNGWGFLPWLNAGADLTVTGVSTSYVTAPAVEYDSSGAFVYFNGNFLTGLGSLALTQYCNPSNAAGLGALHPLIGRVSGADVQDPAVSLPALGTVLYESDFFVGSLSYLCSVFGYPYPSNAPSYAASSQFVAICVNSPSAHDRIYFRLLSDSGFRSVSCSSYNSSSTAVSLSGSPFSLSKSVFQYYDGTWHYATIIDSYYYPTSVATLANSGESGLLLASSAALQGVGLQAGAIERAQDAAADTLSDFISTAVPGLGEWVEGQIGVRTPEDEEEEAIPLGIAGTGSRPAEQPREGETDFDDVNEALQAADVAQQSGAVAENADVIAGMIDWGLGQLFADTSFLRKFPFCLPYDAYAFLAVSTGSRTIDQVITGQLSAPGHIDQGGAGSSFSPVWDLSQQISVGSVSWDFPLVVDFTPYQDFISWLRVLLGGLWTVGLIAALMGHGGGDDN